MSLNRRYIPSPVRRQLRQEAGFGCCVCGGPFVEYHHIIPWAEEKHNNPEHMIALCPTHHAEVAKQSRAIAYDLKANPHNLSTGEVRGKLVSNESSPSFLLGGCTYINTPNVFLYFDMPIVTYEVIDDEKSLSLFIPDSTFWPELLIEHNEIVANPERFWDIDFHHNLVTFRKSLGRKFLEIDFRRPVAEVTGEIEIRGENFRFSPQATSLGGTTLIGCTIENCGAGMGFGNPEVRLLPPNYAMNHPRPLFLDKKSGHTGELGDS